MDYLRDPAEIYRQSFATIRAEVDLRDMPEALRPVAVRMIHACGMPEIAGDIAWSDDLVEAAGAALAAGAPIIADCKMVAEGIIRTRLPADNEILCVIAEPGAREIAERESTTRSAASVTLWQPHLDGAVVAIGNAPTALFRLLETITEGGPRPAAILGLPVGFVGAAESKEALISQPSGIPYLTLRGRRGGSAICAAALNALAGPMS